MTEDNRSASVGGSAESSTIITGDRNTATITITNYYYRENKTLIPVESTDTANDNLPCPYRGLFHFNPDDVEFFFGREVFIEELFTATQTRNFIPLLGASGSGKSSVVLAGLVPKLQNQGHWLFTHFRPGSEPFHALALALVPLYTKNLDDTDKIIQARKLSKSLGDGEIPLADVFAQIHQNNPTHRVLLIADQFEEIYTLCADNKIRHRFLDALLASFSPSSAQSQYNHVLVPTMRADFLGNALEYPSFGDVLKTDIKLIRSMNHDELKSVIYKPAEKLEVTFESGLVERILDDVDSEPGNLPLLEFALTELWKQRQGKQLTHAAYQAIGKVEGALARHADENYGNLSATEKEQVRRIFIQLVQPGKGTQDTRRLATKAELGEASWELVKLLADNRLVVTNHNAANQETVEVVHEALISNWGELRQWMNEDRSFRAWQERLRFAMNQWQNMQRDEGALWRGAVLVEAEEKLKQRRDELSADEQKFIQAGVALRQQRKQRIYFALRLVGSTFVVALGFWGWWNHTTSGQLTQIRWQLTNVSEQIQNSEYQLEAAVVFAKNENFDRAFKLADKIEDSDNKARALTAIASVFAKLEQPEKAALLLQQAINSADKIEDSDNKAQALTAIASVFAKLEQPEKAALLLQQAINSADKIEDSYSKAQALTAIASAIAKLEQPEKATSLLQQVINSADKIEDSRYKAQTLTAIAKVSQPEAVSLLQQVIYFADHKISNSVYKAQVLSDIASVITKLSQPEATSLLQKTIYPAQKIPDSQYKASALNAIAQAFAKLSQPEKAALLLQQAINSADKVEYSYSKAQALSAIAQVIAKLSQPEKAALLLQQAINSADKIESSANKDQVLSAITQVIAKLSQPEKAASLLQQTIHSAHKIESSEYKASALSAIAEVIVKLSQPEKAASLLQQTIHSAHKIENYRYKAQALSAIAQVIGKLSQPEKATSLLQQTINSADKIESSEYKASALSAIAEVIVKLSQPEQAASLLKQAVNSADRIESFQYKAQALSAIAQFIGKLSQPEQAASLLQQAIKSAENISDFRYKAQALSAIAEVFGKLEQTEKSVSLLQQAIKSAENISDFQDKAQAQALKVIIQVAANQKNWGLALKATNKCLSEDCKVEVLSEVLTVHAEQKNPELKEEEEE